MPKIKLYSPRTIKLARNLRKNSTPQERKVWSLLRSSRFYGFKFRRQFPIGKFIADICCVKSKLVIELDGGQHNLDQSINSDRVRDEFFKKFGYRVLRIWNNDVDFNLEGVAEKILDLLKNND